jgi:hypothetical protein
VGNDMSHFFCWVSCVVSIAASAPFYDKPMSNVLDACFAAGLALGLHWMFWRKS